MWRYGPDVPWSVPEGQEALRNPLCRRRLSSVFHQYLSNTVSFVCITSIRLDMLKPSFIIDSHLKC